MSLLKWKLNIATIALSTISLTASKSALAVSLYSVKDLGALTGEAYSDATDINDLGEVVINSANSSFFYSNGSLQKISPLPGNNELAVTSINNLGQVAGNSVNTNNYRGNNPFIYSNGITQPLPINGIPYAINNSGQVVGGTGGGGIFPEQAFPYGAAFLYSNGQTIIINQNLNENYNAYGLNNIGQIVGIFGSPSRAFIYENGQFTNLGTLPGDNYSSAEDINDLGQAIGTSGLDGLDDGRAFLYSPSTGLKDLGRLRSTDKFSVGSGINNLGQAVGFSGTDYDFYGTDDNSLRAFLYEDNTLYDLNKLIAPGSSIGLSLTAASAINNRGQIVGRGTINGELRAFLLTPISSTSVPEPDSSFPILMFGAVMSLFAKFKRKF